MALIPLHPDEVDPFLDHLFRTVGRRPKRLALRESAHVARYLKAVAFQMRPGRDRLLVERVAEMIWDATIAFGNFPGCDRATALTFLATHRDTYLLSVDVGTVSQILENTPPPADVAKQFQPPKLLSSHMSAHGHGNPQLRDDLTERIYAAYYALRGARVRGTRRLIAEALNRAGLTTSAQEGTDPAWTDAEVWERVRQFEKRAGAPEPRKNLPAKWVQLFRPAAGQTC